MDPISKLSQEVKELQRQVNEIIRLAQITEVDVESSTLTCESEGLIQSNIPFFTFRAGEDQTYWLPSIGELGHLLSPSGNTGNAVFLPGIFYDTFPAKEMSETKAKRIFRDELEEEIDTEAHSWKLTTGESERFVDRDKVEDKHVSSINKIDADETKLSRDAGSIKIDDNETLLERSAGSIKIDGSETAIERTAASIKVDGTGTRIERAAGTIEVKVGTTRLVINPVAITGYVAGIGRIQLTAAAANIGGATFVNGVTNLLTAVGPVTYVVIPIV